LIMTSHWTAAPKENVPPARIRGLWFAFLAVFLSLLVPAAWGDVYKWTDERGNTVISNARPAHLDKVKNFEVAVEEPKGAVATPTEKMLLDKLDRLERLLAQQYVQQAQIAPPPTYGSYNPAPPPPPPGYFGSDYSGYYPSLLSSPSFFYGGRSMVSRPRFAFAHSGGAVRGGFAHHGRR
jgi:hypothetical protein